MLSLKIESFKGLGGGSTGPALHAAFARPWAEGLTVKRQLAFLFGVCTEPGIRCRIATLYHQQLHDGGSM